MVQVGYVGEPDHWCPIDGPAQPGARRRHPGLPRQRPAGLARPARHALPQPGDDRPGRPAERRVRDPVSAHEYQITVEMPAGWGYFDIADPTGGNQRQPGGTPRRPVPQGRVGRLEHRAETSPPTASSPPRTTCTCSTTTPRRSPSPTTSPTPAPTRSPQITQLQAVKPSTVNTAGEHLDVTFNTPINLATFTSANLSLTLNGGANLITSNGVTIALVAGTTSTYRDQRPGAVSPPPTAAYSLIVSAVGRPGRPGRRRRSARRRPPGP